MAIHVNSTKHNNKQCFYNSRILFGKYNNKKIIQSSKLVDTYCKIMRMYIFPCNIKSVQKLDFISLSRIIAGKFLANSLFRNLCFEKATCRYSEYERDCKTNCNCYCT